MFTLDTLLPAIIAETRARYTHCFQLSWISTAV